MLYELYGTFAFSSVGRDVFIFLGDLIFFVQLQSALWTNMLLTITRTTADLSDSGIDPPYPSGLSAFVLKTRWEPKTLSCLFVDV